MLESFSSRSPLFRSATARAGHRAPSPSSFQACGRAGGVSGWGEQEAAHRVPSHAACHGGSQHDPYPRQGSQHPLRAPTAPSGAVHIPWLTRHWVILASWPAGGGAAAHQGHVNDDLLLNGLGRALHRLQVLATGPAQPAGHVQEADGGVLQRGRQGQGVVSRGREGWEESACSCLANSNAP